MTSRGVYGLRLSGVPLPDRRLVDVDSGAPLVAVDVQVGPVAAGPSLVTDDGADLRMFGGGRLLVDRAARRATFKSPVPPTQEELVHPLLAPAASLIQQWRGLEVLHGGAFAVDGRAVIVLGARGDGKSSTLAWLAAELGVAVLSDDLIVLDGGRVPAGPRCIDLRPQTSAAFAERWRGDLVRSGERVRLALDAAPIDAELAGVVVLAWGQAEVAPVPPAQCVQALLEQRMFGVLRGDPHAIVDVAALPFWRVSRPRDLSSLARTAAVLRSLLA